MSKATTPYTPSYTPTRGPSRPYRGKGKYRGRGKGKYRGRGGRGGGRRYNNDRDKYSYNDRDRNGYNDRDRYDRNGYNDRNDRNGYNDRDRDRDRNRNSYNDRRGGGYNTYRGDGSRGRDPPGHGRSMYNKLMDNKNSRKDNVEKMNTYTIDRTGTYGDETMISFICTFWEKGHCAFESCHAKCKWHHMCKWCHMVDDHTPEVCGKKRGKAEVYGYKNNRR